MVKSGNVEYMNEAVADFVIRRTQALDPSKVKPEEIATLAQLVKAVNNAPTPLMSIGVAEE